MARSALWHLVEKQSYIFSEGCLEEAPHFLVVFAARRKLETRAGVHSPRPYLSNRLAHVGSIQASGDDDTLRQPLRPRPVKRLATAAVNTGRRSVEKKCIGRVIVENRGVPVAVHPERLPHMAAVMRPLFRRLVPAELHPIDRNPLSNPPHLP